jgi:isopenicillin N synthase-like dioxygenase
MTSNWFEWSSLLSHENLKFAQSIKSHGYAIITLNTLTEEEFHLFSSWERKFSEVFSLPLEEKEKICRFDSIQGQTMGYRQEGLREFIETRLQGKEEATEEEEEGEKLDLSQVLENVLPQTGVEGFDEYVRKLWKVLRKIAIDAISCMAHAIGIDPAYFLDLIDQNSIPPQEISSTVLRICSYPFDINDSKESQISFGSHTDTSFLTIGTVSSTSGLEIFDNMTQSWIQVEQTILSTPLENNQPIVAVFVGDVMHLLTKGFYSASVHRVRTYSHHPLKHQTVPRVSCPLIIRGRHKSKISAVSRYSRCPIRLGITNDASSTPNSTLSSDQTKAEETIFASFIPPSEILPLVPAQVMFDWPDFEGLNMKLIHTLLDRKRQKCRNFQYRMNENGEEVENEEWVLRSFPPSSSIDLSPGRNR